ncbi:hypothetical protein WJX74_004965 [Apatococcus lobatus]|uniref:F-box domain-containing protein n=1 Tax=Apatococcus lobatus TaxID=904363 RepID=A0AAW1Q5E1_9CHLO
MLKALLSTVFKDDDGLNCCLQAQETVQLLDLPQPALAAILTQIDAGSAVRLAQSNKRIFDVFVGCQQSIAAKSLAGVLEQVWWLCLLSASLSSRAQLQSPS